jgi:putative ABC transport system permease protein
VDLDGTSVVPTPGGVVLTRSLARSLGVRVGDPVHLRAMTGRVESAFVVSGLADGTLGTTLTVRREDLQRAVGLPDEVTSVLLTTAPGRVDAVRRTLSAAPDVAHVEDAAALREQIDAMMGLGWALLGVMLACSVVLAAAILFNTATLGILERQRELATLRALGRTLREIAVGFTLEHGLLAVAGLAIGFPLAIVATRRILALYSSDLFTFPFVMAPRTVAVSALGVLLVLLLAQWPALRRLGRMSLADAVRARET